MTSYKNQSYCNPGCYTGSSGSCYGGYGSRIRRYSSGSCYGGIRYVPTCTTGYGSGYGGYGYGNQGTNICYHPYGNSYGSGYCQPRGYGCYPYNYGQGYLGGYGGCGNYGGYGGYGSNGGCGYGYGYRPRCIYTGRHYSYSGPCYGNRRNSICGPCA